MTRELALNNPGGIERDGITWLGQSPDQPDDTFVKFIDMPHGIRAIVKTLRTYQVIDHIDTVGPAIERWAPPSKNDTAAYKADVCTRCGVLEDSAFMPILPQFIRAIVIHENGPVEAAQVTATDIADGIALA